MLLSEIVKNILLENKASSFMKFYNELQREYIPDNAILFDCLMTLKEYYEEYLRYYKEVKKPHEKQEEWKVIRDFSNRLKEIKIALDSDDIRKKIIAIDNGINQWHIDFPVVHHKWMEAGSDDEESEESYGWEEVEDLLIVLGKLPTESPYKYRGNPELFPPNKRHLSAILPRKKF